MKKKNIDDLFKDGLNQESFEYDDQAWKGFEELYKEEEDDDKPVGFPWFKFGIGALALLLLAGIAVYTLNADKNSNNVDASQILNEKNTTDSSKKLDYKNEAPVTATDEFKNTNIESTPSTFQKTQSKNKELKTSQKTIPAANNNQAIENFIQKMQQSRIEIQASTINPPQAPIEEVNRNNFIPPVNSTPSNLTQKLNPTTVAEKNRRQNIGVFSTLESNSLASLIIPSIEEKITDVSVAVNKKRDPIWFLSAAGGVGSLKSKQYELGVGVSIPLSEKISISIVPSYQLTHADALPKHRGFDTKYSVVEETFFGQHIEADQLHYLKLPISLNYNLKGRHHFSIGAAYQYLLAVNGTITKALEGVEQVHRAWIVETGLNRNLFSTQLQYGYRVSPSKELFVSGELFLTDTYTNEVELDVSQKLNSIKIGMKHIFSSK